MKNLHLFFFRCRASCTFDLFAAVDAFGMLSVVTVVPHKFTMLSSSRNSASSMGLQEMLVSYRSNQPLILCRRKISDSALKNFETLIGCLGCQALQESEATVTTAQLSKNSTISRFRIILGALY